MVHPLILVLALIPSLAWGEASKSTPRLTISIGAPVQPDSPVHIVAVHHDERELWFSVSNDSDKTVISVILGNVSWAPSACATGSSSKRLIGHVRSLVRVLPHGSGMAVSRRVHYPKTLFFNARELRAACMLTQFVVDAVYFDDGTTWPTILPGSPASGLAPFHREQSEAKVAKPENVAAVVDGLLSVEEVTFERQGSLISSDDVHVDTPTLHFACALAGSRAVCQMPAQRKSDARKVQPHSE